MRELGVSVDQVPAIGPDLALGLIEDHRKMRTLFGTADTGDVADTYGAIAARSKYLSTMSLVLLSQLFASGLIQLTGALPDEHALVALTEVVRGALVEAVAMGRLELDGIHSDFEIGDVKVWVPLP